MSAPQIEFAYPVNWPVGRPRTAIRKPALFRHEGRKLLFDQAVRRLAQQVELVTPSGRAWRMRELTLSTNFELRADGRLRRDRGVPSDPAVAFFFELDGKPHLLACDRWDATAAAPADLINRRYRELARGAHPDIGGSEAAMARLNVARAEGLKARGEG